MTQQQQRPTQKPGTAVATVTPARLAYPIEVEEEYGINESKWRVLIDAIFPGAKSIDAVKMAIAYCKSRDLDVFKRPVHIVPMWSSVLRRQVESVWPGIAELRTTAARTGVYAGCDPEIYGDTKIETFTGDKVREWNGQETRETITKAVEFPTWCQMTVYRVVAGHRVAFPGPRVIWKETYARDGKTDVPNEMWSKRPFGQVAKCAEAAALRRAFPEALGNEYAAEEMEGREVGPGVWATDDPSTATPPPPERPTRASIAAQAQAPINVIDAETDEEPVIVPRDIAIEVADQVKATEKAATAPTVDPEVAQRRAKRDREFWSREDLEVGVTNYKRMSEWAEAFLGRAAETVTVDELVKLERDNTIAIDSFKAKAPESAAKAFQDKLDAIAKTIEFTLGNPG